MTGAEKADSLCEAIETWWRETGEACSRAAVDHALACAERRRKAYDPDAAVLGHGDAHAWNTMAAPALGPGRYKFIDPTACSRRPTTSAFQPGMARNCWPATSTPWHGSATACSRLAGVEKSHLSGALSNGFLASGARSSAS